MPRKNYKMRAIVIVSGGDAVSPFTTPDAACGSGLSAGNTDTGVREHLLAEGCVVFTAPAMNGPGVVVEPPAESFGAFGQMPEVLPAELTINSIGDIDEAGVSLARFAELLAERYGVDEIDWIGHSNGGLFARAAVRILADSAIHTRSLTTIGSPWCGAVPPQMVLGELPESAAAEHPSLPVIVAATRDEIGTEPPVLAGQQLWSYLEGWNAQQAGVLDEIPCLLIGGTLLQGRGEDSDVRIWPLDGLVSEHSAHARLLPARLLPHAERRSYPLSHSIFISNMLGLDWQTALTWNTQVLTDITAFLRQHG